MDTTITIVKQILLFPGILIVILKILNNMPFKNKSTLFLKLKLIFERLNDENILAHNGYNYISNKSIDYINTDKNKIAYILNNSLPFSNNGYAIRSHHILKTIQSINIDVCAVTRVGVPWDLDKKFESSPMKEIFDDVPYFRLDKKGYRLHDVVASVYINNYIQMLISFMKKKQISIAHGSSDYLTGLATVRAAHALNIPSIYEVRGFWEITRASRERWFKYCISFKMMKRLEIQACTEATKVIALSEIVKMELVKRGIKKDKISVLPNSVDTTKLVPLNKNFQLIQSLKVSNKFVVGFIGSIVDYEGLHLLIEAAKKIELSFPNKFRYLIVGDGNALNTLKSLVRKYSIEHLFIFTGRIAYKEVEQYYSIIDISCYPRLNWEVCSIVSPKKPFESMAYGIPIISSSVKANSYFINDGDTGLIHKAQDSNSLVEKILILYKDITLRNSISKNARDWVIKYRDTSVTGKRLKQIYKEIQEVKIG